MKELCIIGASGHGKVCADIAKLNGYEEIFFLDDDEGITRCVNYDVVGEVSSYIDYVEQKDTIDFFVAIGSSSIRQKFVKQIKSAGGNIVTLIHPDAVIAEDVRIGKGSVVMAGTVINSGAVIGEECIINTASSVDHDCVIGDYVHIAIGAHIAGTVSIGGRTWIGAGAIVSNNLKLCSDCIIGAGAVVVRNITIPGIFVGVPAKNVK